MAVSGSLRFFDVGIFAAANHNVDVFGSNIYLTQMLSASLAQQTQTRREYEEAVLQQNEILMEKKEIELKIIEGQFEMATAMFNLWDEVYS
tara:strand:- start:611 stop:883 length:273 start_codon:yes stop_codon:yes gene_type:complete